MEGIRFDRLTTDKKATGLANVERHVTKILDDRQLTKESVTPEVYDKIREFEVTIAINNCRFSENGEILYTIKKGVLDYGKEQF